MSRAVDFLNLMFENTSVTFTLYNCAGKKQGGDCELVAEEPGVWESPKQAQERANELATKHKVTNGHVTADDEYGRTVGRYWIDPR